MNTAMNSDQNRTFDRSTVYEITVSGRVNTSWSEWFNGMILDMPKPNQNPAHTTMLMNIPDQAALRGALSKIWDLNLCLISVTLVEE
jgi:hypothetical protein